MLYWQHAAAAAAGGQVVKVKTIMLVQYLPNAGVDNDGTTKFSLVVIFGSNASLGCNAQVTFCLTCRVTPAWQRASWPGNKHTR